MADCGSSSRTTSSISDYTRKTTFDPASQAEQDLLAQFSGLGKTQNQALLDRLDALTSGTSPYTLSPEDQAMVDRAYNAAQVELALGNKDYADYLAGGRGLRMSDTPIAQSALQRQGLGLSSLLSEKARTSLDLGLQGNQYRNSAAVGLSSALPAGSLSAFNPLFQERLASGRTHTYGTMSETTENTPSLMDQIGTGLKLTGSLGSLGAGFLTPGVGSLGLGASAAGGAGTVPVGVRGLANNFNNFGVGY